MDGKVYIMGKSCNTLLSDLIADFPEVEVYIEPIEPKFNFNIDFLKDNMYTWVGNIEAKIQPDTLFKVVGDDMHDAVIKLRYPDTIIPNRKHHKKRIQKKWLKRYGYMTKEGEEIGDFKPESVKQVNGVPEVTWRCTK